MSVVHIPAQIVVTCDLCGVTNAENGHGFKSAATLSLDAKMLDVQQNVIGDVNRGLDLCDVCYYTVDTAITDLMLMKKAARAASQGG